MREKQLSVRFSKEEWRRAEAVAAKYGLNVQNVIRMLLKQAHADTTVPQK